MPYLVAGKSDDCCRFGSGVQPWLLAALVVSLEVVVRLAGVRLEGVLVQKW